MTDNILRRLPAEWELQSAVQFTLPHPDTDWGPMLDQVMPCFVECIQAVSRFESVLVVCHDETWARQWLRELPQNRLRLVEAPSNDTWARDHGGIAIFENGQALLWDFVFNGWGLKFAANFDNLITGTLHQAGVFGTTAIRHGGLALEGGALESDGCGTLMTTAACMLSPNRNPHLTEQEIEQALKERFGLERVLWLRHGYLAGDDTDSHIDTLARFCDPKTIAYVQCTDATDEHYEALQQMEAELQAFRTLDGDPYRLVPLPWPEACFANDGHRLPATYANFLIVNGAVLVPIYNTKQDKYAIEILATCFPGKAIIGINCRALIEQHGSLHCISMQYPEGVVV